jgi:zinc transporter ZupT
MGDLFWTAFAASALAACVTTCGIYVIRRFEAWGRQNTTYWACFAAGVLISVSFLHIIPTAFSMAVHGPVYLLIGYLLSTFSIASSPLTFAIAPRPRNTRSDWSRCWESAFTRSSMG